MLLLIIRDFVRLLCCIVTRRGAVVTSSIKFVSDSRKTKCSCNNFDFVNYFNQAANSVNILSNRVVFNEAFGLLRNKNGGLSATIFKVVRKARHIKERVDKKNDYFQNRHDFIIVL